MDPAAPPAPTPEPSPEPVADLTADFPGLLDVRVPVEVVLGTGVLTVGDCLALTRMRIVQLDQSAGLDLMVLANGVPLARAEVVIVEDSTAVRLTEIEAPAGGERA